MILAYILADFKSFFKGHLFHKGTMSLLKGHLLDKTPPFDSKCNSFDFLTKFEIFLGFSNAFIWWHMSRSFQNHNRYLFQPEGISYHLSDLTVWWNLENAIFNLMSKIYKSCRLSVKDFYIFWKKCTLQSFCGNRPILLLQI